MGGRSDRQRAYDDAACSRLLDPVVLGGWLYLARERHAAVSRGVADPFTLGCHDGRIFVRIELEAASRRGLTYGFIDSRDGAIYRVGLAQRMRPTGGPVGDIHAPFEPRSIEPFGLVAASRRP